MNTLGRKRENPDPSVPPPQGWERHFSSSGQEYFVHRQTDHTQWEYPSQSEVENPIAAKKRRDNAERERADALRQEKKKEEKLQRSYLTAIRKRNSEAGESSFYVGSINSSIHLYHFVLIFDRYCCCYSGVEDARKNSGVISLEDGEMSNHTELGATSQVLL